MCPAAVDVCIDEGWQLERRQQCRGVGCPLGGGGVN
jgi:hypothetical protein